MLRECEATADMESAAENAGLTYVSDAMPGIRRKRAGKGFRYESASGVRIEDVATLKRIKALAIPPAWDDVWISATPNGHLQATGRDARGRKQYRYHVRFREVRESTKFDHMLIFAENLPILRRRVLDHLALRGLSREKVLATVVQLLERTLIRVGGDEYARTNKSYGLTTLEHRHVEVEGSALKFNFTGKSGKVWKLSVKDRRIANVIRACQDLPGQDLFQYFDENGARHNLTSSDVNGYLREISGGNVTAKDFRTWHGTVLAAVALQESGSFDSQAKAKRNIRDAIQKVAVRLGNTPTICRKCYIHPEILTAYIEGALQLELKSEPKGNSSSMFAGLSTVEMAVLDLLQMRLS